jgi:hypothetical protein
MGAGRGVRRGLPAAAIVCGFLASGMMTLGASYSAFTAKTDNPNNQYGAGTITLTDDDGGSKMFTTSAATGGQVSGADLKPGTPVANCVKVTYAGTLASTVKLWQSGLTDTAGSGGAAMGGSLRLKVEEGTGGAYGSCAGFAAAATLFDNYITGYPTTAGAGVSSNLASWTNASSRVYRFTVTLDSAAPDTTQGATVSTTFNWTATNS